VKLNKKSYLVDIASAALILFLILVSSTASAATVGQSSLSVDETRITTSGGVISRDIYNDKIVWSTLFGDLYMYDLSTNKETHITTSEPVFTCSIYGNKIFWESWDNGDIYVYNISTKKETRLNTSGPSFGGYSVYGNKLVRSDDSYDGGDIYLYDLYTNKETQITTSGSACCPSIYGDRVVWKDIRDGKHDLYMYNISTQKEIRITNSGAADAHSMYGDRIVWEDRRNEKSNIYMYDISTKKETRITTIGPSYSPSIYGDRIVYEDERDIYGGGRLYLYNISTGQEFHITKGSGFPSIYGDRILWVDNRNDNDGDVYVGTISESEPAPIPPVANFSVSPISGKAPLNVKFTDTSTGSPTSWFWNFGDGSKSFLQNPVHKYSKAGTYNVSLTVKNAAGRNTVTKSKYITVTTKPVAAFSASPTSGKSPLNVKFTDKSTGSPTKWKWDFGDGTISTKQNPTHKYSKAGKYTVTLKVTNAIGINTATKSNYITVTGTSQAPTADFWGWPLSGKAPLKVTFTETSKGSPTSWKWDFGDGKYSTEKSPTHTYSAAGTYTVKLTATNEAGSSTKLKWKYIKVAK